MTNITIIICTYNGGARIERVLDNIYKQHGLRDYVNEVLVVNNNSSDETEHIIHKYASRNLAVPLKCVCEENPGLSNARKKGVDMCSGEWIAFLDDDNFIHQNWIQNIAEYIEKNPHIGAFNGVVIPSIPFEMSKEEEKRLRASLKVLACTHYSEDEVARKPFSPFRNPIGAGLLIRTKPLKKLSENGWLNSDGRTKDNLTSGEDGEMAFYVKSEGYGFGFCTNAVLEHEMSRARLSDDYLNRIWFEIGRGVAVVAKRQNTTTLKIIVYRILLYARLLVYAFKDKYKAKYYKVYIKGYLKELLRGE